MKREIVEQVFVLDFFYSLFNSYLRKFFSNFTLHDCNLIFLL